VIRRSEAACRQLANRCASSDDDAGVALARIQLSAAFSVLGVKRETAALLRKKMRPPWSCGEHAPEPHTARLNEH
jgi:hypothetical protein